MQPFQIMSLLKSLGFSVLLMTAYFLSAPSSVAESSPSDFFQLDDPACTPDDVRVFKKAIDVVFNEDIPCLEKVNPALAAAYVEKIKRNKTALDCAMGTDLMTGPIPATTQSPKNDPKTPILFFATPGYLMKPYSWDSSKPLSEVEATQKTSSTLFHEMFHVLGIDHQSINGKFTDSVFGCQYLCGVKSPAKNIFVDLRGSCRACIFEDLKGNLTLEEKSVLEAKAQALCK